MFFLTWLRFFLTWLQFFLNWQVFLNLTEVFLNLTEVFLNLTEVFLTLTEVFPCLFLRCKANARVKLAKTGHGLHSSTLVVICVVRLLFVLFYVLFVCKCVLPPGDNPTAVNKYIVYHFPTHGYAILMRYIASYTAWTLPSYTRGRRFMPRDPRKGSVDDVMK